MDLASTNVGDMSITTITVLVPQYPVLQNNITCEHSINTKKSKINNNIDLINQPRYLKNELPSLWRRQNSINLENDNEPWY